MSYKDRPERALAARDGRYYRISRLDNALVIPIKTERLTKKLAVDFPLPSAPALFLNLARRAFASLQGSKPSEMFYQWENARVPTNNGALFDYFEAFSSHVVFAFTALEAFANEAIPVDYVYTRRREDGTEQTLRKPDIERSMTIEDKLDLVLPGALSVPSPKGRKLWERFRKIKVMRDRIIHLKAVDVRPTGVEHQSVWGMMLRSHGEPFCDHAHSVMAHYSPAANYRWFREYPYNRREVDHIRDVNPEVYDDPSDPPNDP